MPRIMRSPIVFAALLLLVAASVQAQTTFSCAFDPAGGGDQVSRGFYVTNYPGSSIGTVTVEGSANTAGTYTLSIVAHNGAYNGPVIGSTSASVSLGTGPALTPVVYSFGGAPVAPGSTIAFVQSVTSGPDPVVFINTGLAPCSNVTETEDTTPPLDTFRRDTYGVLITAGAVAAVADVPSLSTAMLVLLALILAGVTAFTARRR
jgi:hypothetical protein